MAVKLKIFDCKYTKKGNFAEDYFFSGDIGTCKIISKTTHKSYVDMANWLDKHKKFKNHVMYFRAGSQFLPSRIVFDGALTWAEGHGYI